MSEQLARLLSPCSAEHFLQHFWGIGHLHVRRNVAGWYDEILAPGEIDDYLESGQRAAAFVNVVSAGSLHPMEEWSHVVPAARGECRVLVPEKLLRLYRAGATVILNQVHHAFPRVSLARRQLQREFAADVGANVYLTPAGSQGFARHSDDHEGFILLIAGSKRFLLYPPGLPRIEVDLAPGDLLYLPRGIEHEAQTAESHSVHLTIGIRGTYAYQLIDQLAARARKLPEFVRLAPCPGDSEESRQAFHQDFLANLQRLVADASEESLSAERRRDLTRATLGMAPGRFTDLILLSSMNLETVLVLRDGITAFSEEDGTVLYVCCGEARIGMPHFMRAAAAQILAGDPFSVREMKGMIADEARVSFVRPFVEQGILSIVRT